MIYLDHRTYRLAERVHALGPRAVGELLLSLGNDFDIEDVVVDRLERYAGIDRNVLVAFGCDTFPSAPLRGVS